jgi:hypothetical protein
MSQDLRHELGGRQTPEPVLERPARHSPALLDGDGVGDDRVVEVEQEDGRGPHAPDLSRRLGADGCRSRSYNPGR